MKKISLDASCLMLLAATGVVRHRSSSIKRKGVCAAHRHYRHGIPPATTGSWRPASLAGSYARAVVLQRF
jgi:hypothetical protein